MGSGSGSGSGGGEGSGSGNPLWMIVWFLILIFISFWIGWFCASWYVVFYMFQACIPSLNGITDLLLKGAQFPNMCATNMMSGKGL